MVGSKTGRRVLVVEDEYYLAHEVAQKLEKMGTAVLGPVGTLREALEIAGDTDTKFDAALLDIALHGEMVLPVAAAKVRKTGRLDGNSNSPDGRGLRLKERRCSGRVPLGGQRAGWHSSLP
jgi:CheY-like chemotaxis protein